MKRTLFTVLLLVLVSIIAHTVENDLIFSYPVPSSKGTIKMTFHAARDDNGVWGASVGVQKYGTPAIPVDTEGEVIIPDNVSFRGETLPVYWISRGAFEYCSRMTKIQLPKNLKYISDMSFQNCASLREITIPDSVWVIYPNAFAGCTELRRVQFSSSTPPMAYNFDTFAYAYPTATLVFPARSAEAYLKSKVCSRFQFHAEILPLYTDEQP